MVAALLLPLLVARSHVQAPVKFARVYKAGESSTYGMELGLAGQGTVNCDVACKVLELKGDGAKVQFTMSKVKTTNGVPPDQAPATTLLLGPNSLPTDFKSANGGEAYIFLILGGVTANQTAAAGQTLSLNWQDDAKVFKLSGTGKVQSIDTTVHKMTVNWDLSISSPPGPTVGMKLTSVYSTDDFSLVHAEGSMSAAGTSVTMKVNKH